MTESNAEWVKWLVTTMIANARMVTLAGDKGRDYVCFTLAAALDAAERRGAEAGKAHILLTLRNRAAQVPMNGVRDFNGFGQSEYNLIMEAARMVEAVPLPGEGKCP